MARLPSVLSRAMLDHLGQTYFEQVWNASDDSGRTNFSLTKLATRLATGSVPVDLSVVGLPTTDTVYAVYRVSASLFGRFINFPSQKWILDSQILADQHVQITTYAVSGRSVPLGSVWLRFDPLHHHVLIAVGYPYTSKCIGQSYPDLAMTIRYDTSRVTPTTQQIFTVSGSMTPTMVRNAVLAAVAAHPAGTIVSVNGWEYLPDHLPTLVGGDIVHLVTDPDTVGYCDLTVDDNVTGYYSERFGEYREVLHIPKALNPNNVTITIDTLSYMVYDPSNGKGIYGHNLSAHAIESITHNDFSISRTSLQYFQNILGAQEVRVRLFVRYPTEAQTLTDEINHISLLYELDDASIKQQLIGLASGQITEWKASKLEASPYLDLLYHFNQLNTQDQLTRFITSMGYYSVASTLAESMHFYTYKGGSVTVYKPARLKGFVCTVLAYVNGRKVPADQIGITDCGGSFDIGFTAGSWVSNGARVGLFITEAGGHDPIAYAPTAVAPTIVVDHDDFYLVQVISHGSTPVIDGSSVTGYKRIPNTSGNYTVTFNSEGKAVYKASSIYYNKQLLLIPATGMTSLLFTIDTMLANKQSLMLPLTITTASNQTMPLIAYGMIEVYLNGYRLIEGIDYSLDPVLGDQDDILQQCLVISNQEYLQLGSSGNTVDVVIHGDEVVSIDKGYVVANKMHRKDTPMLWSPSCGRAFVRGVLQEHVHEDINTLVCDTPVVDGSPYLLEYTIPYGVRKLLKGFDATGDDTLRDRIYLTLERLGVSYPNLITISDQYALYSPYLARITKDVADGTLVIIDESHDDAFLSQFSAYEIIKQRDIILSNPVLLDRRFVTLAAHYTNFTVTNPTQMVLLQRLISLTLLPASLAIDEVLV